MHSIVLVRSCEFVCGRARCEGRGVCTGDGGAEEGMPGSRHLLSLSLSSPSSVARPVRGRQEAMFTYLLITEPRSSPRGIMGFTTQNGLVCALIA